MSKIPELREIPNLPEEIINAGLDGELVLFVGAGVSRMLGLPSWAGLAELAMKDLVASGILNYSELEQLKDLDAKKLLSIADLLAKENDFDLNLPKYLIGKSEDGTIYEYLNKIGSSCVTTNYDELLAPRYLEVKDGSETAADTIRVSDANEFFANLLNEPGTVVHLHGAIGNPKSMVVTTKEYLEHYDHDNVKAFLEELFEKKTILFLGYGLEEAEIIEHILRRGDVSPTGDRRRFALQGYFLSQKPLYENLYTYYEKSFGVHLLGFVRDHEDYSQLDQIVKSWVGQIEIRKPPLAVDKDFMDEVLGVE
jgi:hypothetical protein